jgi:hypothetical protein
LDEYEGNPNKRIAINQPIFLVNTHLNICIDSLDNADDIGPPETQNPSDTEYQRGVAAVIA